MVDPGEDFEANMKPVLRVDDFSEVFNRTSRTTAETLLTTNFTTSNVSTESIDILEKLLA